VVAASSKTEIAYARLLKAVGRFGPVIEERGSALLASAQVDLMA
jgi:hypothetical protein